MEDISPQEQLPPQEGPDRTGEGSAGGSESKKPGSRAPGRKRTKSGCLSELAPFLHAYDLAGCEHSG